MNIRLNKEVLCEGCKRKGIRKLADKCGNEEIAKFLYEVTWKYGIDELIDKLLKSINKDYSKITELSNELLGTLKILEDCTDCKDSTGKFYFDKFYKSI